MSHMLVKFSIFSFKSIVWTEHTDDFVTELISYKVNDHVPTKCYIHTQICYCYCFNLQILQWTNNIIKRLDCIQIVTCTQSHSMKKRTHIWRVVGIKASPRAAWTRGRAERRVQRHLSDHLPPQWRRVKIWIHTHAIWSGGDRRRAGWIERRRTGRRRSPRKAGEPPVGPYSCFFCLKTDRRLVFLCLTLLPRLIHGGQVPHGKRKLSVLLLLDGQTGKLRWMRNIWFNIWVRGIKRYLSYVFLLYLLFYERIEKTIWRNCCFDKKCIKAPLHCS